MLRKTPSGMPSTAEDVLEELAADYPLPRLILDYRGLAKLRSTYTERLPEQINASHRPRAHQLSPGGRRHRTAVLERSEPAEHPDPQRSRAGASARPSSRRPATVLLAADYSQIELRIMAHLSGDEGLLRAFAEERDIHQATAAEVFGVAARARCPPISAARPRPSTSA